MAKKHRTAPNLSLLGGALYSMNTTRDRLKSWLLLNSSEKTAPLQHLVRIIEADIELIEEQMTGQQVITDD